MMAQPQPKIGHPPPSSERRRAVECALDQAGGATHFVPGEDGYLELPVVMVDSSWLVYRIDNGRILSELADAADAQQTTTDDFKRRSESKTVQELLHRLLVEKAQDPSGPIFQELAKHGRQTEPLLIVRDGLVLNGNRRLAAMRELARREPDRYRSFGEVRAAVLPEDIDREHLEYIEAALQMAPELKLGYSWINRRLKLREHARDLSPERVVAAYRFASSEQIEVELGELVLAEEYLEWIGEPGHYQRVGEHELRFTELRRQLVSIGAPHVGELWKLIGFAMIRGEDELEANIAHYFPFTDPVPPAQRHWVLRSLAEDRELVARQPPGQNKPVDQHLAARLRPALDDPTRAASTARAVLALIDVLKGDPQRLLGSHRVLHHLRSARRVLEELDVDDLTDVDVRGVRAETAALEQHVRAFERRDPDERPLPIQAQQRLRRPVQMVRRTLGRWLGR